jgi:hypothetical protein
MIKAIKTIVSNVFDKITGKKTEKVAIPSYIAKRDIHSVPDFIK